ncbi:MAG: TonB-dependent receptor plug domain-containing protein [Steroidobacteraceae bacterium]|nr:TonB-dependent receptor plug domain-containing protein [Steroidobacteraceae bacterium]
MKTFEGKLGRAAAVLLGAWLCATGPATAVAEDKAAAPAAAGASAASQDTLGEVIVEGQRITIEDRMTTLAVDSAKFGTQVQVITAAEIDTGGFTNFGELAAGLIRGANIGYSPDEGEFTIRIDGGSDRDTLLLLDGVPTFDRGTPLEDLWGATALDPRMIENVEILRGGQSLYYGGNGGLGVVAVYYKEPGDELKGEFGTYWGSFKTREVYGNVSYPVDSEGRHSVMAYGRSYETDAHEIFSREAYNDVVLELGGRHDFPYTYNLIGGKYRWRINEVTDLKLGAELATIDFRDSFPNDHIFNLNYTEYPKFHGRFRTEFTDRISFEAEAFYQAPTLKNSEVDAQICRIPQTVLNPATGRPFTTAAAFEAHARANNIPAGCVTNPTGSGKADSNSRDGFYVDEQGRILGTLTNPFRVGDGMGFVIQSIAGFGTGVPVKGFGEGTQFTAGYKEYGANARTKIRWNEIFETVVGAQSVISQDNSAEEYGVRDDKIRSTGVYADLRANLDFLEGTALSVAGRQDFNNLFDDTFIWRASVRQEFPRGYYFRGSAGTSYANPRAQELGLWRSTVSNPSLETQEVETFGLGLGINGDALGGTFNVEVGYFDTEIGNLFGNAQIRDVCPGVDPTRVINPNIVTPVEFCANWQANGLSPLSTATFNTRAVQDIKGYTFDVALDLDQWTLDFSFTKQESFEPNPVFGLTAVRAGTGQALTTIVPGRAGGERFRQSGERPEWMASALLTYEPNDRWILSLNPRWQGPEYLYVQNNAARLVDANGNRTNPDVNFGDYFVLNGSIQYFMGDARQHRLMLRIVNVLGEDYWERGGATDRAFSRAAVRGEIGPTTPDFFYTYGWNGKPRSYYFQYEYNF